MRIGAASRTYPGESLCGDGAAWWGEGSATLVCLADGLGHGAEAHLAARAILAVARDCAGLDPAPRLAAIDRAVRRTRGGAALLARIDPAAMRLSLAGVGNVRAGLFGQETRRFDGTPGIVGAGPRELRPLDLAFAAGDALVLWTDGLAPVELDADERRLRGDPQRLAGRLLARFGRAEDDATVICVGLPGDQDRAGP
ncbi:protein serine/threonine phosphatase [Methylobacterium sp. 4-46]|uniref:SpoIIE family protein phosphatase n=1 Tax=unclassified Methylobacterium TaxID=2615210 RepID=UPI000152D0FA|nr:MULTISPECIES: SpoIIE family protein phosphatase [Methylobacterium]ACA20819.1 protein serine/threonine phosphatase [Methylobacterium sp. 4-46]WFT79974.1 SpoIIE family protein phosphatase [Methylobacterium nodulans]